MKLPRDLDGESLIRALARIGYSKTRQAGSHVRMTLHDLPEHHVTVPLHSPLRVGTLAAVLGDVASRQGVDRVSLLERLFG